MSENQSGKEQAEPLSDVVNGSVRGGSFGASGEAIAVFIVFILIFVVLFIVQKSRLEESALVCGGLIGVFAGMLLTSYYRTVSSIHWDQAGLSARTMWQTVRIPWGQVCFIELITPATVGAVDVRVQYANERGRVSIITLPVVLRDEAHAFLKYAALATTVSSERSRRDVSVMVLGLQNGEPPGLITVLLTSGSAVGIVLGVLTDLWGIASVFVVVAVSLLTRWFLLRRLDPSLQKLCELVADRKEWRLGVRARYGPLLPWLVELRELRHQHPR